MRIALFGTSADPPTAGHQKILRWLSEGYDRVAVWAADNPFKCHQKYCTKSKQICDDFNLLKKHLIMERHFRAVEKLNLMIKTIKKCVKNENKLKSKDVCIKSENCFLKQHNLFSGASYKFINNSKVCPCGNGHRFKCNGNNNFCGVNKEAAAAIVLDIILREALFVFKSIIGLVFCATV